MTEFTFNFIALKQEFLDATLSRFTHLSRFLLSASSSVKNSTYAQVLKPVQNTSVKPISELKQFLNPAVFRIGGIEQTGDGGVVFGCSEGIDALKEIAEKTLVQV